MQKLPARDANKPCRKCWTSRRLGQPLGTSQPIRSVKDHQRSLEGNCVLARKEKTDEAATCIGVGISIDEECTRICSRRRTRTRQNRTNLICCVLNDQKCGLPELWILSDELSLLKLWMSNGVAFPNDEYFSSMIEDATRPYRPGAQSKGRGHRQCWLPCEH